MVLNTELDRLCPVRDFVASPVNYGVGCAGAGGGCVVAEPEQGVHADGFPVLDGC
jgi:hypothetical protein